MASDGMAAYGRRHVAATRRYLRRSLCSFAPKDIHDLRVEIKRLRAFTDLLSWMDPGLQPKRRMQPLRRVFKAAGTLRDIHVQRNLVEGHAGARVHRLGEFINRLQQLETAARQRYARVAAQFDPSHLLALMSALDAFLASAGSRELRWKTEQGLAVKLSRLADLQNESSLAEADLHKIRIMCKATRYTLEALCSLIRGAEPFHEALNDRLRDCHRALGQWHDADLGVAFVERFLTEEALQPLADEAAYGQYRQTLKKQGDVRKNEFYDSWKKLMALLQAEALPPVSQAL